MKPDPIDIILEKCTGCKLCEKACPYDAIEVVDKKAIVNEKCTLCGACLDACKFDAIVITRRTFKGQDIASYSGICSGWSSSRGWAGSVSCGWDCSAVSALAVLEERRRVLAGLITLSSSLSG